MGFVGEVAFHGQASSIFEASCAMGVFVLSLMLQVCVRPFFYPLHNKLEVTSSGCTGMQWCVAATT